ncbi:MAG: hypothetical protein KI793_00190 [Rivularia sp. (in: Bacteria)]|nr:hypothetical protein [Rivularia sp. MS3]
MLMLGYGAISNFLVKTHIYKSTAIATYNAFLNYRMVRHGINKLTLSYQSYSSRGTPYFLN